MKKVDKVYDDCISFCNECAFRSSISFPWFLCESKESLLRDIRDYIERINSGFYVDYIVRVVYETIDSDSGLLRDFFYIFNGLTYGHFRSSNIVGIMIVSPAGLIYVYGQNVFRCSLDIDFPDYILSHS